MNHNLNHLTLLRNKEITIVADNDTRVQFRLPTLDAYMVDTNLTILLNIMKMDLKEFKVDETFAFQNHYELLLYLCFNGDLQNNLTDILQEHINDLRIQENGLYVGITRIKPEEFEFIIQAFKIALGLKKLDDMEDPDLIEDEYAKKTRQAEERLQRIKKKGAKEQGTENGFELDTIMLGVIKEFGFSMDQLLSMNIYTLLWFYRYVWKINAYNVETIAYGNGLIKKHKHYLD
jgi:phage anti-repressor protein